MPVNKGVLGEVLGGVGGFPVLHRSLYGNTVGGGVWGEDVKVRGGGEGLPGGGWVSTSPGSWAGVAGHLIRGMFGLRSRFEVEA